MDDSALAGLAAAGDQRAFSELVERHGGRVLAVARRIAGEPALAEDLCQDVWLHLLRVLPRYDRARPFVPWLLEVTANLSRNKVRGLRRRPASSLDAAAEAGDEPPSRDAPRPDEALERDEIARIVRDARDRLPPAYRTILALRYEGGLAVEEIAAALGGVPVGTVKNRLFRAREALAARLERVRGSVDT